MLTFTFFHPFPLTELNDNLQVFQPVIDPETGQMTGYKTSIGGADTVFPFSKMSGTLQIGFSFKTTMNKNDGGIGSGSGTITILFTNGEIANRTITGSGSAGTVGAQGVASGCTMSNFTITSVKWIPD